LANRFLKADDVIFEPIAHDKAKSLNLRIIGQVYFGIVFVLLKFEELPHWVLYTYDVFQPGNKFLKETRFEIINCVDKDAKPKTLYVHTG
jgi:hypothetical protein